MVGNLVGWMGENSAQEGREDYRFSRGKLTFCYKYQSIQALAYSTHMAYIKIGFQTFLSWEKYLHNMKILTFRLAMKPTCDVV